MKTVRGDCSAVILVLSGVVSRYAQESLASLDAPPLVLTEVIPLEGIKVHFDQFGTSECSSRHFRAAVEKSTPAYFRSLFAHAQWQRNEDVLRHEGSQGAFHPRPRGSSKSR